MTSWDDGSTSMASVDLLSPASINNNNDQPSSDDSNNNMIDLLGGSDDCNNTNVTNQNNLEQIEETVEATSALSLTSSSPQEHQQQHEQQKHTVITSACQIDFDVEHVGKNKPQSKRMAIWKYGLPHQQQSSSPSLSSDGNNDAATNNNTILEHEAKLVWSTHSGKYTISVDGEEIYTSIAKGSVLEHKFKWDHTKACLGEDDNDTNVIPMRIIACRKPPTRSSKDFRCYEFIIGGKVFRDLPTIDGGEPPSPTNGEGGGGGEFENEYYNMNEGKLMSILDVIEPGWRATGFA